MSHSSPDPQILQDLLQRFMDEHIYPNETEYHRQLNDRADRFLTVPLMEELKAINLAPKMSIEEAVGGTGETN